MERCLRLIGDDDMKKIYGSIYQVWLLNRNKDVVELLVKDKNDYGRLVVLISLENNCIFDYRPLYNYCYANQETYNDHIMKAIEVLKNEQR